MHLCKMLIGLSLGLFACNALAAARQCPDLTSANVAIQARADELIKRIDDILKAMKARGVAPSIAASTAAGPDFIVALTGVIVARAREEARIWLVDRISDAVCDVTKPERRGYFPNTCQAVDVGASYPGISMTALRTELRKDLYALPACHQYLTNTAVAPADDIDPYVLEAALVAAYYVHHGKEPPEGVPTIDKPDLLNQDIAKLLVAVAIAKLNLKDFTPRITGELCPRKRQECLEEAIAHIQGLLDKKASPEKIVAYLLQQIAAWEADAELQLLASAYLAAASGNYLEAALKTAARMKCDTAPLNKLCVHLPLLAEVADAETQEEMSAALDRAISPLGAWKRKQSEQVVALNSKIGRAHV